ncbi:MAG: hypothetical protein ACR2HF_03540 [Methylococcaceae bacterium]
MTQVVLANINNETCQNYTVEDQDPLFTLNAYANVIHVPAIIKQARKIHGEVNQRLDAILHDFLDGATIGGWLPTQWAHFIHNALAYQIIWDELAKRYSTSLWHVLIPNQPYCLGNHSCIPALALVNTLESKGIHYIAYSTEISGLGEPGFPDLRNISKNIELLCHIPTCFYDKDYFYQEIASSGLTYGILNSEAFDVSPPENMPTSGLCYLHDMLGELDTADIEQVNQLESPIRQCLEEILVLLIRQLDYKTLQVNFLWERIRNQCYFFLWLEKHFSTQKPWQFLLSNHDVMLHGALLSFAKKHNIHVTIVPHSKVFNYPFIYINEQVPPLCLHHALQDGPCVDTTGKILPSRRMTFAGVWKQDMACPQQIKSVGIILNGTYPTHLEKFFKGLLHIKQWAGQNNIRPRFRVRSLLPLLSISKILGVPLMELEKDGQGSVLDFAKGCDMLISYDLHSSAVLEVLREGYTVIHADVQSEIHPYWCIVDALVVPRFSVHELLERLSMMVACPEYFQEFRHRQRRSVLEAMTTARTLGYWLQNRVNVFCK